jgi:acetyl-CoA carboxylase biotin carboxyl carrier protein
VYLSAVGALAVVGGALLPGLLLARLLRHGDLRSFVLGTDPTGAPPETLPGGCHAAGGRFVIGYHSHGSCDPSDWRDEEGRTVADEIHAEMVANVWKVVAKAGDQVEEGDTLVILESMKMEIPVIAEADGTVREIAVNEGDVVQEGDLIAVVE